jgi:CDP-glucose 4,6-dehydratase
VEGLDVNPEFWQGKKVLLTGHTGFKGSWLALWLQSLGAEVIGYSLPPPTQPNLFDLAQVGQHMVSIQGDVRDLQHLERVIRDHQPSIVIHMAAQALVRRSYLDPVGTYATNVLGTVHMLEAIRCADAVRALLIVTSDKCYENREELRAYLETDPMGGFDPYSSSKGCAELVTAAYRSSYFSSPSGRAAVAVASVRSGNVIGGGDWAEDRLVPDLMRALLEGQEAIIRNPDAVRPWQHVLEPLSGYLLLVQKLCEDGTRYSQSWNFGPDEAEARPVLWIVEHLAQLWGPDTRWTVDRGHQPHEAHYLKLDSAKARALLGWQPQWGLARALEVTVTWYKAYQSGQDTRPLVLEQIRSYQNALRLHAVSGR